MNIKKLKSYDLHQAKVGDLVLCWSLNKGEVVYIDHNQVVVRWEDTLNIFDIEEEHCMYLRPLAWLGEDPVYKGDVIYSRHFPEFVADQFSCGRLYLVSGSYMTMDGDELQPHELFHNYHFASHDLEKLGITHCMASAVIVTFTVLGGRTVGPVAIRDGLSEATIKALQEDMRRSFEQATAFKPKGLIGE